MIIERKADRLITYESQPDGGQTPIIDPYDGCSIGCPYCFQLNDPDWNEAIYVKTGIDKLIRPELEHWPKRESIYLRSRCDPYMTIEGKYQLTRRCLSELSEMGIATMITTKGDTDLIRRDIDIYRMFGTSLTILLGFSRLSDHWGTRSGLSAKIDIARTLCRHRIQVWAFVTPVLPGITDVEFIRNELPEEVPIFIDYLRYADSQRQKEMMEDHIRRRFPELADDYDQTLSSGVHRYYDDLLERYGEDERFSFLFR